MTSKTNSAFADKKMLGRAIKESFLKLNPKTQLQNPVMLLVYLSAILTTGLWIVSLFGLKDASSGYTFSIAVIYGLPVSLQILQKRLPRAEEKPRLTR